MIFRLPEFNYIAKNEFYKNEDEKIGVFVGF